MYQQKQIELEEKNFKYDSLILEQKKINTEILNYMYLETKINYDKAEKEKSKTNTH